jgi:hypothetical protein
MGASLSAPSSGVERSSGASAESSAGAASLDGSGACAGAAPGSQISVSDSA